MLKERQSLALILHLCRNRKGRVIERERADWKL